MLVATIELDRDTEEVRAQTDAAQVAADEAWSHASRVLIDVFLLSPSEVMEMREGWTRSLLVGGAVVYQQRAEHAPDELAIHANWKFTAQFPHHRGYGGWSPVTC